jgi:tetratricopeptide (TPR) repeat protein
MTQMRSRFVQSIALALLLGGCPGPETPPPHLVADPPPTDDGMPPGAGQGDLDRADTLLQNERWDEALPYAEKALAAQPDNGAAHFYVALAKYRLGDVEAAEKGFVAALDNQAGAPADRRDLLATNARAYLGEIYLGAEPPRAKEAIEVLTPALSTAPNDPVVHELLGFAHRVEGDFAAAAKHYKKALAENDNPDVRFQYADALFEAQKYDQVAAELRKLLPAYAEDVEKVAFIAHRFAKSKAYDDCIKAFDIAVGLKKSEPSFYLYRGMCRHELGKEDEARADYTKALEIDARFQPAHYAMGQSWLTSKQRAKAVKAFEQTIKLGKDTDVGKAAQKKLAEMAQKP